jgi:hypothetical protein
MKSSWIGSIAYCSQASSVVHVCRLPGKDYFISTTSASKVIPKAAEVAVPVTIDRSTVRAVYHIYICDPCRVRSPPSSCEHASILSLVPSSALYRFCCSSTPSCKLCSVFVPCIDIVHDVCCCIRTCCACRVQIAGREQAPGALYYAKLC